MSNDYLIRILTKTGNVRALACVTTELVNEVCQRHGTSVTASTALGRVLTGTGLMGALLKPGQRVAVKFEGNGPLKKILAEKTTIVLGVETEPIDLLKGIPDIQPKQATSGTRD